MALHREKRTTPGGATYFVKVASPREARTKARPAPQPLAPVPAGAEPVKVIAAAEPDLAPPPGARRGAPKAK